jgi:hypothetical protein
VTDIPTAVVFLKALVLPLGVGMAYLAYRAYRRTGATSLRSLALGLAVITAGALLGGGLDRVIGIDIELGVLVNSILTAVGFAILARSLYVPDSNLPVGETDAPSDQ